MTMQLSYILSLSLLITPYLPVFALVIDQGSSGSSGVWFEACNKSVTCGSSIGPLGFPFWGGSRPKQCGYPHLGIRCEAGIAFMESGGMEFQVPEVDTALHLVTLTRDDLQRDGTYRNTTVDASLLRYETGTKNLTLLYGCQNPNTNRSQFPGQFHCNMTGMGYYQEGVVNPRLLGCNNSVVVPIRMDLEPLIPGAGLRNIILRGFRVKYSLTLGDEELCRGCSGSCGYNETDHKSVCFQPGAVAESRKWSYRKFIVPVIVVWCIAVAMVIVMLVLHYYGIATRLW